MQDEAIANQSSGEQKLWACRKGCVCKKYREKLWMGMVEPKGHTMGRGCTHMLLAKQVLLFPFPAWAPPPRDSDCHRCLGGGSVNLHVNQCPRAFTILGRSEEKLWLFCEMTCTHLSSFSSSQTIDIQTKRHITPFSHLHVFSYVVLLAWNSSPFFSLW